ncbi:MAG: PQQ-binding-like beta-propeller repeat protein [Acidimicrobiia bacterium]|nr:PQQ-binding-like beta-propeller repeat protein [Acidimicrobiia bacterium]
MSAYRIRRLAFVAIVLIGASCATDLDSVNPSEPEPGPAYLYAVDAKTGTEAWRRLVPHPGTPWLQLVGDQLVYSGSASVEPAAFDLDGRELWRAAESSWRHGPFLLAGAALVGVASRPDHERAEMESVVTAISRTDGSVTWSHRLEFYPEPGKGGGVTGGSGRVFAAGGEIGTIIAFDHATGEPAWERRFDGSVHGVAHHHDGTVYIGTSNGLVALDAVHGAELWTAEPGRTVGGPEGISNGNALSWLGSDATGRSDVAAVDAVSGERRWSQTSFRQFHVGGDVIVGFAPGTSGSSDEAVLVWDGATGELVADVEVGGIDPRSVGIADSRVYVGTQVSGQETEPGRLVAIDLATGTVSWTAALRGSLGVPTVADGVVYVSAAARWTDQSGALHAVDAETGAVLWSFDTPAEIRTKPIVVDGRVFVVAADTVWADL